MSAGPTRRAVLAAAPLAWAAGCERGAQPPDPAAWQGGWVGASYARGHLLRQASPPDAADTPGPVRRCAVAVLGAGVAGLAAARALVRAGVDDVRVFELEDEAGGNARGHTLGGLPCPLGAHYLPVPPAQAQAVSQWLHEIGLLRSQAGRTVALERHLCHAPQERLWTGREWVEGLLPPAPAGSDTLRQYRLFARRVAEVSGQARFAIPASAAAWSAALQALDERTFAQWLHDQGLDDPALRWYLDYACRDDYGAGLDAVSAWAGLHYFASRHGFAAHADDDDGALASEGVFTWPEGNAWLTRRLASDLGARLDAACWVRRVQEGRHEVVVDVQHAGPRGRERWVAREAVVALPLHVARRVVVQAPAALPALTAAAAALDHAPWLVANLLLREPLLDRPGVPAAWDSVFYEPDLAASGAGRYALGYVDARHQGLRPRDAPTVLTAYWAFGQRDRAQTATIRRQLLDEPWQAWAQRVVAHLARVHPDLPQLLDRVDLMRYGHAMAVPGPGVRSHPALRALREGVAGRLHAAHADLAGYSVFEEAFTLGDAAGRRAAARLGRPVPPA